MISCRFLTLRKAHVVRSRSWLYLTLFDYLPQVFSAAESAQSICAKPLRSRWPRLGLYPLAADCTPYITLAYLAIPSPTVSVLFSATAFLLRRRSARPQIALLLYPTRFPTHSTSAQLTIYTDPSFRLHLPNNLVLNCLHLGLGL